LVDDGSLMLRSSNTRTICFAHGMYVALMSSFNDNVVDRCHLTCFKPPAPRRRPPQRP